jgi:hypothetical protein
LQGSGDLGADRSPDHPEKSKRDATCVPAGSTAIGSNGNEEIDALIARPRGTRALRPKYALILNVGNVRLDETVERSLIIMLRRLTSANLDAIPGAG